MNRAISFPGGLNRLVTRRDARRLGALIAVELLVLGAYFGLTASTVTSPRYALYPFVWINVGLWALWRVDAPPAGGRRRWLGGALAVGYFLVLAYLTGMVGVSLGHSHSHSHVQGWLFVLGAPGWTPRIGYATHLWHVYFVPFRFVGFVALAYLLYVSVLDATGAAVSGVLGFASCVSCAFPIVAPSVAALLGGSVPLAGAITALSIDLSTAVFVVAVALLAWRPGTG